MLLISKSLNIIGRFNLNASIAQFSTIADVQVNVPEPRVSSSQVAQFRRGLGGRASFSGNVITVFGGTGYLGIRLVNQLAKSGNQLIIPYRCDPYWVRELKISGDLGQILFFPFNLKDEDAIRKAVKYSNIVINLIGTRVNTKNFSLYDTHEHGSRRIARIARESGVERLIHISAMSADPNYKSRADFLRSKGLGEIAVHEEFPTATIIRPSLMYGPFDKFIYPMLSRWRKNPRDWIKVYKSGEDTFKMPIFVNDVSKGITKAVFDPTSHSKIYEFVGPHNYRFSELIDYMYSKARVVPRMSFTYHRHDHFDPWYFVIKHLCKAHMKVFRKNAPINMEWIEYVEAANDILTGVPTISDLGVQRLSEFENVGGAHAFFNSYCRVYEERYNELDIQPPLPIRSPPIYKDQPFPPPIKRSANRSWFVLAVFDTFFRSLTQSVLKKN